MTKMIGLKNLSAQYYRAPALGDEHIRNPEVTSSDACLQKKMEALPMRSHTPNDRCKTHKAKVLKQLAKKQEQEKQLNQKLALENNNFLVVEKELAQKMESKKITKAHKRKLILKMCQKRRRN
ncbi:hypothetical protein NDU88_001912 [Pleurodeles waltl]|uniref:Uncharacterized protein n=1 Tax=Pleurodeles waltl TaxID=8319 RepID=A0AAV7P570_PLEWA|nr:hypothetical protein NDU88_001912 [Pleurodeles waltl]